MTKVVHGEKHALARWIAGTLPLALAAAFVHVLSEWVFAATKVSSLTVLSPSERILVLFQTLIPFVPYLLGVQFVFTVLSLFAGPRFHIVAAIPAAVILGCTAFVMFDNFTYVILGYSCLDASSWHLYPYGALAVLFVGLIARAISRQLLPRLATARATAFDLALWLVAAPLAGLYIQDVFVRPKPLPLPMKPVSIHRQALPNILILTTDGIDAVRLSAYGYREPTSPAFMRMRNESLFCENAFANAARTHGSLTSMLTGKLPTETRVTFPPTVLTGDARYQHLPGILGQYGYRRLQLTVRHYADAADTNMLGAFDLSNYRWEDVLRLNVAPEAGDTSRVFRNQVVDRLTERIQHVFSLGETSDAFRYVMGRRLSIFWSDERRIDTLIDFINATEEPWFAQVHLTDSHEGERRSDAFPPAPGLDEYDAVIRAADDRLGRVLTVLQRTGKLESTIVVTGSDHGRYWHTRQRVPLAIRFPNGAHRRLESQNVQLLDVAPTLLDYLEIPIPSWMTGSSLLPIPVRSRPIHSVHDIGTQRFESSRINSLEDPGPPRYGIRSAGLILGSTWYELDLENGGFGYGPVAGHTVPQPADPALARSLISRHLDQNGFPVPGGNAVAGTPLETRSRPREAPPTRMFDHSP